MTISVTMDVASNSNLTNAVRGLLDGPSLASIESVCRVIIEGQRFIAAEERFLAEERAVGFLAACAARAARELAASTETSHSSESPTLSTSGSSSSSFSSSICSPTAELSPLDVLLTSSFPTREDAVEAIRLFEYNEADAGLVYDKSMSGGLRAVYFCESPECTVKYTVRKSSTRRDGVRWFVEADPGGIHISCRRLSRRPVPMKSIARGVKGVRAQCMNQTNRVQSSEVAPSALSSAALVDGFHLSPSNVSRVKALVRKELTEIAMSGYKKVVWYCSELVRLNPGTVCYVQVRDVRTGVVTDIRYAFSDRTNSASASAVLPSSPQTLHSVVVVPRSSVLVAEFTEAPVFGDFARMYHSDGEARVSEFVLSTQLCDHNISLLYGLFDGPECGAFSKYIREILRRDLKAVCGHLRIFGSDRAWHERRNWRRENGNFPKCCNVHFCRNIAKADPQRWKGGGKEAVLKFMYARSFPEYEEARDKLQKSYKKLWEYMVTSDDDQ